MHLAPVSVKLAVEGYISGIEGVNSKSLDPRSVQRFVDQFFRNSLSNRKLVPSIGEIKDASDNLRLYTNPRGTYIHASSNGVDSYYVQENVISDGETTIYEYTKVAPLGIRNNALEYHNDVTPVANTDTESNDLEEREMYGSTDVTVPQVLEYSEEDWNSLEIESLDGYFAEETLGTNETLGTKETGNERLFSLSNNQDIEAVNNRFNEELQQQIDGKLEKTHVYGFGMPSAILKSAGIPSLPIELRASRLSDKSMQENHQFDMAEIKDLPRAVQNPMAVFRSATHIGSNVILTELVHEGKNFIVAIETNRQKGKILINDIRSIHPRTA